MRSSIAAIAALVLALTACASDPAPDSASETTQTSSAPADEPTDDATTPATPDVVEPVISSDGMPTVTGEGAETRLDFEGATDPGQLQVSVVTEGDGREVTAADMVVANYAGQVWGNDEPFDSSFQRGSATAFPLSNVVQGWRDGLSGQKVGSRVVISIPAELGYGPQGGQPSAGIGAEDTIAFVVDIVDAFASDSSGDPDAKPEDVTDLPVDIEGGLGEKVTVTVKDGAEEPSEPEMTVLATSDGEPVGGEGTTAYIQFSAATWDNATQESSYDFGGLQSVQLNPESPFAELEGVPVGSRVLITIPATEQVPAMAAVVDIVGQLAPATDDGEDK